MRNSEPEEPSVSLVELQKTEPSITPPGRHLKFSIKQAILIAQFVDSPVYKLLKTVYATQRRDVIARVGMQEAQNTERLHYYKGLVAEVTLFFRNMEDAKLMLEKSEDPEAKKYKK